MTDAATTTTDDDKKRRSNPFGIKKLRDSRYFPFLFGSIYLYIYIYIYVWKRRRERGEKASERK
jgi:hypothetical protein